MTIYTRSTAGAGVTVKGSPLSTAEVDNNFIELAASARTNIANTFTAEQTISTTGAQPFLVETNFAGSASVSFKNTDGNNTMSANVSAAGTGSAFLTAYNASGATLLGNIGWGNLGIWSLVAVGQTRYDIDASAIHRVRGAVDNGTYYFGDNDLSNYFQISTSPTKIQITTNTATMEVAGQDEVILLTSTGNHFKVVDSGQRSSDGVGYSGTLYPSFDCRGMGGADTSGTTWASTGVTVTRNSANNYTAANTMPVGIGTNYHVSFCATESAGSETYTAKVTAKSNGSITYVFSDDEGDVPSDDIAHTLSFFW